MGRVHEEQTGFPLATSLGSVVSLIKWFRLFFSFSFFESRDGGAGVPKGTPVRRPKPAGNLPGYASTHPVVVVYSSITSQVSRHPVCSRGWFRPYLLLLGIGAPCPTSLPFSRETGSVYLRIDDEWACFRRCDRVR